MNAATQHQPAESRSTHSSPNLAAGPQSALGIPSVGAAPARPAALYLALTDGTVLLVRSARFRAPSAGELAALPFRNVPVVSESALWFDVAATFESYLREMGEEPCARADIGNDCRCRECVERRVEQAEWTMGAECER